MIKFKAWWLVLPSLSLLACSTPAPAPTLAQEQQAVQQLATQGPPSLPAQLPPQCSQPAVNYTDAQLSALSGTDLQAVVVARLQRVRDCGN